MGRLFRRDNSTRAATETWRAELIQRQAHVIGQLRELRVTLQDLQLLLASVRAGEADLCGGAIYIRRATQRVEDVLVGVQKAMEEGGLGGREQLAHITNLWEQIRGVPCLSQPESTDIDAQTQTHSLNMIDQRCREIIFHIASWTIPDRLNAWLDNARTGYYIPFHAVFDDEVRDPTDRAKLLNHLAWAPKTIPTGLIDVANGLVYRYDPRRWRQWLSLIELALIFAVFTGLVAYAANPQQSHTVGSITIPGIGDLSGWPINGAGLEGKLVAGWFAVFAGVLVHVAVGLAKSMQAQTGMPPVLARSDLLPRINAHWGRMILKMLLALFAFFSLALTLGATKVTLVNFFLAGYTLDSIVELFGANLEGRAGAQLASLKRQPASGGGS